jgi:two-component system LytT family response regulator
MLEAIRRQAFDYLLKPPTEQDLSLLMARYYENKLASIPNIPKAEEHLPIILVVNAMNEHITLNLSDIAFFRFNQERKIWEIVCSDNSIYSLRHRTTTNVILNYSPDFVQIHKRYIVNINKIKMIQESSCILEEPLDDNRELKISKNYRQSLMAAFYSM